MKILVLGSGLMGPAAAYNAMKDPEVERITLGDVDAAKVEAAVAKLRALPGGERVDGMVIDLTDHDRAVESVAGYDVIVAALHWRVSMHAFGVALRAGVPIVDLAIPEDADVPGLRAAAEAAGGMILLGCGLEPGLTEIVARRLAGRLDRVEELHIKCGGVPEEPSGPLGYKIVFGGMQLPLREIPALAVEQGVGHLVQRYSGLEPSAFDGVGMFEAWHEGMMPWLLDMPEFSALTEGSQKTIRWPGYSEKATVLLDLGLLQQRPIAVGGVEISPKQVVDAVLYPHVKLGDDEGDITLFRVDVIGPAGGKRLRHRSDMVDRIDRTLGFTSMARTTAFTGAIAARMIGRGDLRAVGVFTAEALIEGELYDRMMAELEAEGIHFDERVDEVA